jgi:hypothetical protein
MAAFQSFIGGSYRSQSPIADQERTVNWYEERMESPGATTRAVLYPTPGVEAFAHVADVGGRAMFSGNTTSAHVQTNTGRVFGVVGTGFYEFFPGGTSTKHGTVAIDANPATISTNGDGGGQLFITSGDHGYCFDLGTNTLTEVLTSGAAQGGMLYGYFVAFDRENSRIRISDLFDGTVWDPTQFADRTIGSDPWRAMAITPYGQICLPGTQSGEFWYNAGNFPFPFAPDPSGLFAAGVTATFSIQVAGDAIVWLGARSEGGYQVLAATGFTPQRLSNHALEFAIAGYRRIDDAIGQTYSEQGHLFYLLTFPTVNVTWGYDFATQQWHERGTWIAETASYDYWRPVFHCFAFGKHLMADRQSGVIYHMANDLPLDVDGRVIRRMRRSPAIVREHLRTFFDKLEILLEAGLGTSTGQGADPTVMLRLSNDGGRTWGNERTASAGRMGAYTARVLWWRLGMARDRVFEVTVSDPIVNWRLIAAYLVTRKSQEAA